MLKARDNNPGMSLCLCLLVFLPSPCSDASDDSDSDAYLLLVLRPVRWSAAGNPRGAPALSTSGSWPCRCLSSSWRFSHIMPIRSRCGRNSIVSPSRLLNHSSNTRRLSLSFRNSIPPISPIPTTPLLRPRSGRSRSSSDPV